MYTVDIRGSDLTADNIDNLRLAGPEARSVDNRFPVMNARVDGQLLRIQVAEFASPPDPYLWRLKQQPTFLVTALRDGLAALTDAGLANLLVRGEVQGRPATITAPPRLLPAQQDAYRACMGSGLWLVWGPPGTGKTHVIQAAVSDLLTAGKRVLLVSGTNIAVDNALLGVIRDHRTKPGEIVRVGPPHLREIAENPHVCLAAMAQATVAEIEEKRREVAMELLNSGRREERLADLEARLTGFDGPAYEAALALLAGPERTAAGTKRALATHQELAETGMRKINRAQDELAALARAETETAPARELWAEAAVKEAELAQVEEATLQAEARSLVAENDRATALAAVTSLHRADGKIRWRDRKAARDAQSNLEAAKPEYDRLSEVAIRARAIADALRQRTEVAVAQTAARAGLSREEVQRRDIAATRIRSRLNNLELAQQSLVAQLATTRAAHATAVAAEEFITQLHTARLAKIASRRDRLAAGGRPPTRQRRPALEKRHAELQQQYEKLARGA